MNAESDTKTRPRPSLHIRICGVEPPLHFRIQYSSDCQKFISSRKWLLKVYSLRFETSRTPLSQPTKKPPRRQLDFASMRSMANMIASAKTQYWQTITQHLRGNSPTAERPFLGTHSSQSVSNSLCTWLIRASSIYLTLAARKFVPLEIVDIIRDFACEPQIDIWILNTSVWGVRKSWAPTSTTEATGPEVKGLRLAGCGWVGPHTCY